MNATNLHKYAKMRGNFPGTYVLDYAPSSLTPEECISQGYKRIIEVYPEHIDGVLVPAKYEEDDESMTFVYECAQVPTTPRVFSKYKLIEKAMMFGWWAQIKVQIENAGLYDLFLAAQDFKEDNPFFQQGLNMIQSVFQIPQEQLEQILNDCAVEAS